MSAHAKLVIVTGLSGSGKSVVAKCLEDIGFYVVDNLPLSLMGTFLEAPFEQVSGQDRIAVVADVRAPGFAQEFPRLLSGIDRRLRGTTLLFLDAADEALIRRFSETRRPHPLAAAGSDLPLPQAIRMERELLAELRGMADMVIDTSSWSIPEVRREIVETFAGSEGTPGMLVSLTSFGFKRGIPAGTDLMFDVRFLANPHFVPELKPLCGRDPEILAFLQQQPDFGELVQRLADLLLYLLPRYRAELRSYLSVAVGCTGGQHRSVAVCEVLRERLAAAGWTVRVQHRDLPTAEE